MTTIVLATHNRDKARELEAIFADPGLVVRTLDDFPAVGPIAEDADTLEGNALKKAAEVFRATGIPSMGDDTGLEVYYLNDRPGVFSSRYAGPGATYADNVRLLLRELRGVPPRRRGARFRCVLSLVTGDGSPLVAGGECRGTILEAPRGLGGFGYDPVFVPDGHLETLAEMSLDQKNRISHRARAGAAMRSLLLSRTSNFSCR